MTITPQDIQAKQFHVRMRGFDMDEVDKFLEKIAEELLILSLENKQLLDKVETMDKELANYKNKEQAFQSAILSAQRISDEMQSRSRQESEEIVENAKKSAEKLEAEIGQEVAQLVEKSRQEAAELVANAETEARQILADSQKEHSDLTSSINHLIEIKSRIMADMRQLLNNYLDHIDEAVPTGLNALEPLPEAKEFTPAPAAPDKAASREENPAPPISSGDSADNNLEDLYEKIDLPEQSEEEALAGLNQPAILDITDFEPLDSDDGGEMLFSLEDPLDELEPSVSISEDDKPD